MNKLMFWGKVFFNDLHTSAESYIIAHDWKNRSSAARKYLSSSEADLVAWPVASSWKQIKGLNDAQSLQITEEVEIKQLE